MENEQTQNLDAKKTVRKLLYIISFVFIILFFGVGIFLMVYFDIPQDSTIFTNSIISLIGLLFSAILFASCIANKFNGQKKDSLFCILLFFVCFDFFLASLSSVLSVDEKYGNLVKFIYTLYYVVGVLFWLVLWFYTIEFLPEKKYFKTITVFSVSVAAIYVIAIIINAFIPIFFEIESGRVSFVNGDVFSSTVIALWCLVLLIVVLTSKIKGRLKLALLTFEIFPIMAGALNAFFVFFKLNLEIEFSGIFELVPAYAMFITLYVDQKSELEKQKADNVDIKTAIMLSQIQPHFIYNALATISGLSREEGAMRTREAINKFADYLRVNIDSLRSSQYVPFEKELEHIKTYLWIEKMRFGDDVKIEYDIKFSNFELPTLTIQPLVENAVKHGICKKENGGTVKISTDFTGNGDVIIKVEDDGVGFDVNAEPKDGKTHVGITNIKSRLETLGKGELEIESEIGKGTTATLIIYGGNKYERFNS